MRPRRRRRDRQPLDIGIPAADNTHEVAQGIASETRMVHVDYDPVVPAHARALLTNTEEGATEYIDADLHGTGTIPAWAVSLLDFSRPVAVTLLAVPHAIPDADAPYAIVARLMDAVPPGSYLAISHGASDLLDQETWKSIGGSGTAGSSSSSYGAAATRSHGSSPARTWSNPAWCRWRNGGRNWTAPTRPSRRDGAPWAGSDEGSTRSTLPFCWIYLSLPNGLWLRVPRHGSRDSRSPPLSAVLLSFGTEDCLRLEWPGLEAGRTVDDLVDRP